MGKLTGPMIRLIDDFNAGSVASTNADGTPAVSPKGTFVVIDDGCIAFGNIRSPATVENLRARPDVELNFIDVLTRRAVRLRGRAQVLEPSSEGAQRLLPAFKERWAEYVEHMHDLVSITVTHAEMILSPAYDFGHTADELHRANLDKLSGLSRKPHEDAGKGAGAPGSLDVEMDLGTARRDAEAARQLLRALGERHDLSQWEYTRRVRIAPLELPHSHPVLTLNARDVRDEDTFLSTYLHEQIHWGLDLHREDETARAIARLRDIYPGAHRGLPETGADEYTTYLHFVVNWLEIFAAAGYIGRERAVAAARRAPVHTRIYRAAIEDGETIEATLREVGILPLPPATGERRAE